jgi:DUF2970 family protein
MDALPGCSGHGGNRGDTIDSVMPSPESSPPDPPSAPPPASLWRVAGAVFWSFFGVRKGKDMQQDAVTIKPLHLIIVGLLSGLAFVLVLVALVTFLTRHT